MENEQWMKQSFDDIIFIGRNKSYGAFQLRRLYNKHMSQAMISGILFFLLAVSSPKIVWMIRGFLPGMQEEPAMAILTLTEPPPLVPKAPPPPTLPKAAPPPLNDQIKFVPPVVKKDPEVLEEEQIPTNDMIKNKEIAIETREGDESGVDPSLIEPDNIPTSPPVLEENLKDKVFTFVEQMPSFPDGQEAMYKYIYEHIKYPPVALQNGISGTVTIQFVVSREGEIQKAHVVRGIPGGCNEEALRVINSMPKWKPGKHNGQAVPVTFTMQIKFVLQ